MNTRYITSESVCIGHPDKLCDLISDSILDACLEKDDNSRVACEVMATKGNIFVAGEISCKEKISVRETVRKVLSEVGYDPAEYRIYVYTHPQSNDIANGVNRSLETREMNDCDLGAGDQGTVYGYATDETPDYLPLSEYLAHGICRQLDKCMRDGSILGIGPDGKCQVSVKFEDGKPVSISNVTVSVQHNIRKSRTILRDELINKVILPIIGSIPLCNDDILINPSGSFIEGGPSADTGLTGRKIIVDTYGGQAFHGGGAFSGKDPTKVDRSAAYMARAVAKNLIKANLASRCQVAISYAIGKANPVAIDVDTFGTGKIRDSRIAEIVTEAFDLRPSAIIRDLDLKNVKYANTSMYGHFGNHEHRTWENLDRQHEIEVAVNRT